MSSVSAAMVNSTENLKKHNWPTCIQHRTKNLQEVANSKKIQLPFIGQYQMEIPSLIQSHIYHVRHPPPSIHNPLKNSTGASENHLFMFQNVSLATHQFNMSACCHCLCNGIIWRHYRVTSIDRHWKVLLKWTSQMTHFGLVEANIKCSSIPSPRSWIT